jgi:hypothetical protein
MFSTKEILKDWSEKGNRSFQESNNDFVIRQHSSKEQLIYATHILYEFELNPHLERKDLGCSVMFMTISSIIINSSRRSP